MADSEAMGVRWPNVVLVHGFNAHGGVSLSSIGDPVLVGRLELDSPMDVGDFQEIHDALQQPNPTEEVGILWVQTRLRHALRSHAAFVFAGLAQDSLRLMEETSESQDASASGQRGDSFPTLPPTRIEILDDHGSDAPSGTIVRFIQDISFNHWIKDFLLEDGSVDYGSFLSDFRRYVLETFEADSPEVQTVMRALPE